MTLVDIVTEWDTKDIVQVSYSGEGNVWLVKLVGDKDGCITTDDVYHLERYDPSVYIDWSDFE